MNVWALVAVVGGPLATIMAAVWAARSARLVQKRAVEADRLRVQIQNEPNQRLADLASYQEIRKDMEQRLSRVEAREKSLWELVWSFSRHVENLTTQMRSSGLDPAPAPRRIREYYRTGR